MSTSPGEQPSARSSSAGATRVRDLLADTREAFLVVALWLVAVLPGPAPLERTADGGAPQDAATVAVRIATVVASDLTAPGTPIADGWGTGTSRLLSSPDRDGSSTGPRVAWRRHVSGPEAGRPSGSQGIQSDRPLTLRHLSVAVHPDRAHAPPLHA